VEALQLDRCASDSAIKASACWIMAEEYHQFIDINEVRDADDFVIARARLLVRAVEKQRDYSIVQLLRHGTDAVPRFECIVLDVKVEGVPPKNPYGINYRERLALCVPADPLPDWENPTCRVGKSVAGGEPG
jgi:hypothetical protein